jgi:hypothetical protein
LASKWKYLNERIHKWRGGSAEDERIPLSYTPVVDSDHKKEEGDDKV